MSIEFRKELFADERDDNLNEIGKPTQRQDMVGHVTGRSPFYDDHLFEGLLHMRCVRSPHHHARIRSIDVSAAQAVPGVRRVILGKDVPHNLNTLLSLLDFGLDDEPLISDKKVSYKGEPVVAIVAESDRIAREAVAKVRVDWEVLPHVLDVEEAIAPNAPVVNETYPGNLFIYHGKYNHQKLRYGDVDAAFAQADHVIEGRYQMSPIEQAPTETCGAIAAPETNNRFVCYTSTQALFFSLGTAAKLLNVASNRLHFIGGTVGGGFGGKVDSLHEPMAILGTMLTGRPCKYMFDRAEEMQVGAPRGAERWYVTDGVMNDGRLVARKFVGYFDSGAYTRLSSYAIIKAAGHLPGPYTIPNVYADIYCVFTNRTPATAMRGFGITGVDFAIEAHMDKVAEQIGMDPIEFRILNAYRDGDMKAHRRLAKNTALIECCQVAAEKAKWPISDEARRQDSLTGGGGDRAQLPNFTKTDQDGRVEGFSTGSYAQKTGSQQSAQPAPQPASPPPTPSVQPQPSNQPAATQQPTPPSPPRQPAPPPPTVQVPFSSSPTPPPPQPPASPSGGAPRRTTRFSSISGLRRR
jgi:CO/xanthine dehydrogenase Mo-binding subunit